MNNFLRLINYKQFIRLSVETHTLSTHIIR